MAERQIPGGAFINEDEAFQRQIPGSGFINRSSERLYEDTITFDKSWTQQPQRLVTLNSKIKAPREWYLPSVDAHLLQKSKVSVVIDHGPYVLNKCIVAGHNQAISPTYSIDSTQETRNRTLLVVGNGVQILAHFSGGQGTSLGLSVQGGYYKHQVTSNTYSNGDLISTVPENTYVSYCGSAGVTGSYAAFNGVLQVHGSFSGDLDGDIRLFGGWGARNVALAVWWDVQLPQTLVESLSKNPWAIFAERKIIIPNNKILTAPVLRSASASNINATGFKPRVVVE
jgi:hypothetical protein